MAQGRLKHGCMAMACEVERGAKGCGLDAVRRDDLLTQWCTARREALWEISREANELMGRW